MKINKAVLLYGPPFVGKGTIARQLALALGFQHIETSEVLKSHIPSFQEMKARGILAPDAQMIEYLSNIDASDSILDSLRTAKQVEWFVGNMTSRSRVVGIKVHVRFKELKRRLIDAPKTERGARNDDDELMRRYQIYQDNAPIVCRIMKDNFPYYELNGEADRDTVYNQALRICRGTLY